MGPPVHIKFQDYPICPYLVSTVWQYGDSKLGGWVYDTSLQVSFERVKETVSVISSDLHEQIKMP